MKNTYAVPQSNKEEIQKQLERLGKKAAKYGKELTWEFGEPYAKEVGIYDVGMGQDGYMVRSLKNTLKVEVCNLTINGTEICKDGYTVAARIEHLDGGNIVTVFDGQLKPEWNHIDAYCEHCGIHRRRNLTFIVRHENGEEKQVGSTCLFDYCGIDPQSIGIIEHVREMICVEDTDSDEFCWSGIPRVYDPIEVLAFAIATERQYGYTKSSDVGSNKSRIADLIHKREPSAEYKAAAVAMAKEIEEMDESDAIEFLLINVKSILKSQYCKSQHFGYIAYAPTAFKKYEVELKKKAENTSQKRSEYMGDIGERRTFNIEEMELVTSYETMYGITFLYKFVDENGNVLVWFASKQIKETKAIIGTIKDHRERDGVKQTIITRCKIA